MDKQKQLLVLTAAGCLGVLLAGWFLLVSPKHAEAADLRDQAASQQEANATARTRLTVLKAQAKDLPVQQAKIAAVAAKIPDNPALPALIRQLDAASAESGVELLSIAPGSATPVGAPVAGAVPGELTPGLNSMTVSMQVAGGFFEVEQYVSRLEAMQRAVRVTTVSMSPGKDPVDPAAASDSTGAAAATTADDGRALVASISAQVYLAPTVGSVAAAAPAAAPAAGTAATTTAPTTTAAATPVASPAS